MRIVLILQVIHRERVIVRNDSPAPDDLHVDSGDEIAVVHHVEDVIMSEVVPGTIVEDVPVSDCRMLLIVGCTI